MSAASQKAISEGGKRSWARRKAGIYGTAWLPIESAPKTGEHILVWDGFTVFEGLWNGYWCTADYKGRPHTTHWQPLPRPPISGAAE